VRYEIFGSLRVIDGDRTFAINAPKLQVLLAALLIRADHIVTGDQLVAEVWGDRPPRRAIDGLYVYVSHLRKIIKRAGGDAGAILTQPHGYLLRLGGAEFDLRTFEQLMARGRTAAHAGCHGDAAGSFQEALSLWRRPNLAGLGGGSILSGCAAWMEQAYLECVEGLAEAKLSLGLHREVISFLYSQVNEHPLHEAFYRQLMLALHRAERRSDALKVYQTARAALNDELGLEPNRALQSLHQTILCDGDETVAPLRPDRWDVPRSA
jgi:SARP family transcriptional regulator, regulator of embCAB operon